MSEQIKRHSKWQSKRLNFKNVISFTYQKKTTSDFKISSPSKDFDKKVMKSFAQRKFLSQVKAFFSSDIYIKISDNIITIKEVFSSVVLIVFKGLVRR